MSKELYDTWVEQVNQMTEEEKQKLYKAIENDRKIIQARYRATVLYYEKAFVQVEDCEYFGEGEYCVYMWLHADGTPFYVGMGKGDRWKSTNRNERFFEETKKLDTFVCKVVDGLSSEQAREAEFCLTHYLTYNGYKLANWDNNFTRVNNERSADRRVGKYARLMLEKHNKMVIEQAKNKMKPYEIPFDYELVREQYIYKYGNLV